MTPAQTITVTSENHTLSQLIWRTFKRPMAGYLERVLDANLGLAKADAFLPVGLQIAFPEVELLPLDKEPDVIRLWS